MREKRGPGPLRAWWRRVRPGILAPLVYGLVRLLLETVRLEVRGYERYREGSREGGVVFLGWHGRSALGAKLFRGEGIWTIISQSRDGEMQNRIFRWFGFRTIRGSTGRGGMQALLESIKVLKTGAAMAFTVDGPRGPSGVVQAGVMLMAKKSGAALVPVGVSAERRWLVRSWDRYMVPKPFTRAVMIFGDPVLVPLGCSDEELERLRREVEEATHRLEVEAEGVYGHPAPDWHARRG